MYMSKCLEIDELKRNQACSLIDVDKHVFSVETVNKTQEVCTCTAEDLTCIHKEVRDQFVFQLNLYFLCAFAGPIASALSNKYGFRSVTMFGGMVAGLSFFASTFSPTVNWLIFLYGFCGGRPLIALRIYQVISLLLISFSCDNRFMDLYI